MSFIWYRDCLIPVRRATGNDGWQHLLAEGEALITNPDHNRTRHGPILADELVVQCQVSDYLRQSGCTLQAGDHGRSAGSKVERAALSLARGSSNQVSNH